VNLCPNSYKSAMKWMYSLDSMVAPPLNQFLLFVPSSSVLNTGLCSLGLSLSILNHAHGKKTYRYWFHRKGTLGTSLCESEASQHVPLANGRIQCEVVLCLWREDYSAGSAEDSVGGSIDSVGGSSSDCGARRACSCGILSVSGICAMFCE